MRSLEPGEDHKWYDLNNVVEDGLAKVFYSETDGSEKEISIILEKELT